MNPARLFIARRIIARRIIDQTSHKVQQQLAGGARPEDVAAYVDLQYRRIERLGLDVALQADEFVVVARRRQVVAA